MTFGFAFAHESMTSRSTAGLFTTDVDEFLDVNEWQNVAPENMFGYLGFGENGKSNLELGLAKQFGSLYFGVGFTGVLPGWSSTTTIGKDSNGTQAKTTSTESGQIQVLAGFGDIGILLDAKYTPGGSSNTSTAKPDNTLNNTTKFALNTNLKIGLNKNGPRDLLFKSFVKVGLDANVNRTDTKNKAGKTTLADSSSYALALGGGTSFDYKTDDTWTQTFGIELEDTIKFGAHVTGKTEDDKKTKKYGGFDNSLAITPKWTFTFEPSEVFSLKFAPEVKVSLPFKTNEPSYTEFDGKKAYEAASTSFGFLFTPKLSFGAVYFVKPDKFRINAGTSLALKEFGWKTTVTGERKKPDEAALDADKKVTKVTWDFPEQALKLELTTGFTFFLNDAVTIDANWNIGKNLFTKNFNFTTNFTEGDSSIWNTVNKLFIHNFAFLVSVKF